jgi:hypothetical protein
LTDLRPDFDPSLDSHDNVVNRPFFHAKQGFGAGQQSQQMTPFPQDHDAVQHHVNKAFFN